MGEKVLKRFSYESGLNAFKLVLHDLLLNGSNLLPIDINLQLFNVVEEYIVNSQRFAS